jgi:hypothetical protein
VPGNRIGCAEALSEDATQVEREAQREPWVREPKPLERRLR